MKLIKRMAMGFCIGTTIGVFISIVVNYSFALEYYSPGGTEIVARFGSVNTMLLSTLLSGLIGMVASSSSVIYDSEKRSLLLSSIIHFSLICITVLLIGLFLGWYNDVASFLSLVLINIGIYFCFWIPNYIISKKRVEKLNKQLLNRK